MAASPTGEDALDEAIEWDPSLADMCKENGLSRSKFEKKRKTITVLEGFQTKTLDLHACRAFPAVEEVTLIHCLGVRSLTNLPQLEALRELHVAECGIRSMRGLSVCKSLERVVLDGNRISVIEDVRSLPRLKQLWANDNRIASLAGVEGCAALEQLWVARNRIETVGRYLDSCSCLNELNLADNRVSHFREVQHLARVTSLRSLALSDPHWGANPVCALCNYSTFALFQLPHIETLDCVKLAPDVKHSAESTFRKKRMYYNMRIKILRRNTSNVIRRASVALRSRLRALRGAARPLEQAVRDLAFSAAKGIRGTGPVAPPPARLVQALVACIAQQMASEALLRARFLSLRSTLSAISSLHTERLLMELGTGGNVRLEVGRPSDVWYKSCVDLVQSRFHAHDFAPLGVTGVRVLRVTRIHNRRLRSRFDGRMAAILAADPALAAEVHATSKANAAGKGKGKGRNEEYTAPFQELERVAKAARTEEFSDASAAAAASSSSYGLAGHRAGRHPQRRALEYLFFNLPWRGVASADRVTEGTGRVLPAARAPEEVLSVLQGIAEDGFSDHHAGALSPAPPLEEQYAVLPPPHYSANSRTFAKAVVQQEQKRSLQTARTRVACGAGLWPPELPDPGHTAPAKAFGLPFSNSLSPLDVPRVTEAVCERLACAGVSVGPRQPAQVPGPSLPQARTAEELEAALQRAGRGAESLLTALQTGAEAEPGMPPSPSGVSAAIATAAAAAGAGGGGGAPGGGEAAIAAVVQPSAAGPARQALGKLIRRMMGQPGATTLPPGPDLLTLARSAEEGGAAEAAWRPAAIASLQEASRERQEPGSHISSMCFCPRLLPEEEAVARSAELRVAARRRAREAQHAKEAEAAWQAGLKEAKRAEAKRSKKKGGAGRPGSAAPAGADGGSTPAAAPEPVRPELPALAPDSPGTQGRHRQQASARASTEAGRFGEALPERWEGGWHPDDWWEPLGFCNGQVGGLTTATNAAAAAGALGPLAGPDVRVGVLLVTKVFLGRCVADEDAASMEAAFSNPEMADSVYGPAGPRHPSNLPEVVESGEPHSPPTSPLVSPSRAGSSRRHQLGSPTPGSPSRQGHGVASAAPLLPPRVHSVVSHRRDDARQRQWCLLDPALALPEYVIEYSFQFAGDPERVDPSAAASKTVTQELNALADIAVGGHGGRAGDGPDEGEDEEVAGGGAAVALSPQEEVDLAPLVRPLARFVEECRASRLGPPNATMAGQHDAVEAALVGASTALADPAERQALCADEVMAAVQDALPAGGWQGGDEVLGALLDAADSATAARQATGFVTRAAVESGLRMLPDGPWLSLHGLSLSTLDGLAEELEVATGSALSGPIGPQLVSLNLSFNSLSDTDELRSALSATPALRRLDLSHNSLASLLHSRHHLQRTQAGAAEAGTAVRLCPLGVCPELRVLVASDNRLVHLMDELPTVAAACPLLEELSVMHNPAALASIDAEHTDPQAEARDEHLGDTQRHGGEVRFLFAGGPRFRRGIASLFTNLRLLDGAEVCEAERERSDGFRGVTTAMVKAHAHDAMKQLVWQPGESTKAAHQAGQATAAATAEAATAEAGAGGAGLGDDDEDDDPEPVDEEELERRRWAVVDSIDLRGLELERLEGPGLGRATRCRTLVAADNEIRIPSGISHMTRLEELSLEGNLIASQLSAAEHAALMAVQAGAAVSTALALRVPEAAAARADGEQGGEDAERAAVRPLEALAPLARCLQRLDLSKNRLTSFEGLQGFSRLMQLSVEDNDISSLQGLASLQNLLELYAGNNRIRKVKDVIALKELPRLIILDLCGNPACGARRYRLYTVYHLRRLKVLDGKAVDEAERKSANEKYSGRLTIDLLEERFGDRQALEALTSMAMSNQRLRDVETLPPNLLKSLQTLDLQQNLMTGHGLMGLRSLPKLSALNLNNNKVSTLLPALLGDADADQRSHSPRGAYRRNGRRPPPPLPRPPPGVSYFSALEVLRLDSNAVSDMMQLGLHLLGPTLKVLSLRANDITRVAGLQHCSALRQLRLDNNRLRQVDAESFKGLAALRELSLRENHLKQVGDAVTNLQALQVLDVGSNRISDISELERLAALPYLADLNAAGNPVARRQLYRLGVLRHLDLLRSLDGRKVSDEERRQADELFTAEQQQAGGYYLQPTPSALGLVQGLPQLAGAAGVGSGVVGGSGVGAGMLAALPGGRAAAPQAGGGGSRAGAMHVVPVSIGGNVASRSGVGVESFGIGPASSRPGGRSLLARAGGHGVAMNPSARHRDPSVRRRGTGGPAVGGQRWRPRR